MPREVLSLLDDMLKLNPASRCTAASALNHDWLRDVDPEQVEPPHLPAQQDCHEMWAKMKKLQKRIDGTSVSKPVARRAPARGWIDEKIF